MDELMFFTSHFCSYGIGPTRSELLVVFYAVDSKERQTGNNPEKELLDNGFHDYQRPYVADLIFKLQLKAIRRLTISSMSLF